MNDASEAVYGAIWMTGRNSYKNENAFKSKSRQASEDKADSEDDMLNGYVDMSAVAAIRPSSFIPTARFTATYMQDPTIDVYTVNDPPELFSLDAPPLPHRSFMSRERLPAFDFHPRTDYKQPVTASNATSVTSPKQNLAISSILSENSTSNTADLDSNKYEEIGSLLQNYTRGESADCVWLVSAIDSCVRQLPKQTFSGFPFANGSDLPDCHFHHGRSALADAVVQHRIEMANAGGVVLRVRRDELLLHVAFVELNGSIYCAGYSSQRNPAVARLHRAFRCGDQLIALDGSTADCRSLNSFRAGLQKGPRMATIRLRRTPFAKSFVVRISRSDNLAAYLKPGSPTIRTVPFRSPLDRASLQPRATPCVCGLDSMNPTAGAASASNCVGRWRITEINERSVSLFATRRDVEPLLRISRNLISVDALTKPKERDFRSVRSRFDQLPTRIRSDSESESSPQRVAFDRSTPQAAVVGRSVSVSMSVSAAVNRNNLRSARLHKPPALPSNLTAESGTSAKSSNSSIAEQTTRTKSEEKMNEEFDRDLEIALVVQPYCLIKAFKKQVAKSKPLRNLLTAA